MNKTVVENLTEIKRLGSMPVGHAEVARIMLRLYDELPAKEWQQIKEAREGLLSGRGRNELDMVCNNLIQKYRHNPPDPRKRTLL